MGKRKVISEEELKEFVLPEEQELIGRVVKLLGSDHVLVRCVDGNERVCRIRGRMKHRMWVRDGDIVLVAPWEFKRDERGDILRRYTIDQVDWLKGNGYLPKEF